VGRKKRLFRNQGCMESAATTNDDERRFPKRKERRIHGHTGKSAKVRLAADPDKPLVRGKPALSTSDIEGAKKRETGCRLLPEGVETSYGIRGGIVKIVTMAR